MYNKIAPPSREMCPLPAISMCSQDLLSTTAMAPVLSESWVKLEEKIQYVSCAFLTLVFKFSLFLACEP